MEISARISEKLVVLILRDGALRRRLVEVLSALDVILMTFDGLPSDGVWSRTGIQGALLIVDDSSLSGDPHDLHERWSMIVIVTADVPSPPCDPRVRHLHHDAIVDVAPGIITAWREVSLSEPSPRQTRCAALREDC